MSTYAGEFPVQLVLVPGELRARVYAHDAGSTEHPVPCWTYVSDGLRAHGQDELVFTLRRDAGEEAVEFPHDPFRLFVQVLQLAQSGQIVQAGDTTQFGSNGFLGHHGLAYVAPHTYEGVELSSPSLAAILLSGEEVDAANAFGVTRVMARLGQTEQHYPCPPWSDRTRPPIRFDKTMQDSVLAQTTRLRCPGASACIESRRIVLRLGPSSGAELVNRLTGLTSDAPIALLTALDRSADGCLVWEPGQTEPSAITPPDSRGERLSGCFLLFVPGQDEDAGRVLEDGLMLLLTEGSWTKLKAALEVGTALTIPATNSEMGFTLEWLEKDYVSPIDGTVYRAERGWRTAQPAGSAKATANATDVQQIVLLTPEEQVGARLAVEDLVTFIEGVKETVRAYFVAVEPNGGQDLTLQFELQGRGEFDLKMASRPGLSTEILRGLYDRLHEVSAPGTAGGPVAFQIAFTIWKDADRKG
jgi:hypothetical protein